MFACGACSGLVTPWLVICRIIKLLQTAATNYLGHRAFLGSPFEDVGRELLTSQKSLSRKAASLENCITYYNMRTSSLAIIASTPPS